MLLFKLLTNTCKLRDDVKRERNLSVDWNGLPEHVAFSGIILMFSCLTTLGIFWEIKKQKVLPCNLFSNSLYTIRMALKHHIYMAIELQNMENEFY